MNKVRPIVLLLCVTALITTSYFTIAIQRRDNAQRDQPDRPDADTAIAFWQKRIGQNPTAYLDYTLLGEAYTRKARETGDVNYYQRAEAALHKALEINPNYVQAAALLSTVLFSLHDFEGALALAEPLTKEARVVQALATVGDAHLALGHYDEAETAYQKFADFQPSAAAYSRQAFLASLHGEPDQAIALMQQASDLAWQSGDYGESLAWYEYQLGELYFKSGRLAQTEDHFQAALDVFADNYLALAGLGKVRAAQGRYPEAITFYEQAVAIIPQPDILAALGDVYTLTGQSEAAQREYSTVEFIGQLAAINQVVYNRQLVLFYANHDLKLTEALELAEKEIAVRQDIYGYDAWAWALYKNGQYAKAAEAAEQALQLGTRDALLYYHAGMIYQGLGDAEHAQALLAEALLINPYFDLMQTRLAQAALDQLRAH